MSMTKMMLGAMLGRPNRLLKSINRMYRRAIVLLRRIYMTHGSSISLTEATQDMVIKEATQGLQTNILETNS